MSDQPQNPPPPWGFERCPFCGGTTFSWGALYDEGRYIGPKPMQINLNLIKSSNAPSRQFVNARMCNNCGNIQLFAEKNNPPG